VASRRARRAIPFLAPSRLIAPHDGLLGDEATTARASALRIDTCIEQVRAFVARCLG
jgi:hypothetical protein